MTTYLDRSTTCVEWPGGHVTGEGFQLLLDL